jgi:glycosyltransferase involved in cell wall biosynthesis
LNQGRFIEETIQSVLSQDYPNMEYWVVDGGSIDNTLQVLRKYESRLHWISEKDHGQSEAINKGIRMSKGEIIAWLNSDDTYLPGAVSKAVEYLEAHPDIVMVYGEGYLIDEKGFLKDRFQATQPFDLSTLINVRDFILQQTVFFRRRVLQQVGMLDESLRYGMDWDYWIRIGKKSKVAYIPDYLANLREYPEAKSFSGGLERFRELVTIMRRHSRRRFPPAYLYYGWEPVQLAITAKLKRNLPWLGWEWLSHFCTWVRKACLLLLMSSIGQGNHSRGKGSGEV